MHRQPTLATLSFCSQVSCRAVHVSPTSMIFVGKEYFAHAREMRLRRTDIARLHECVGGKILHRLFGGILNIRMKMCGRSLLRLAGSIG